MTSFITGETRAHVSETMCQGHLTQSPESSHAEKNKPQLPGKFSGLGSSHSLSMWVLLCTCPVFLHTWRAGELPAGADLGLAAAPCVLGSAASPSVPAGSGRACVPLLSCPGNRNRGHVPYPHEAGPEAVPQAGE